MDYKSFDKLNDTFNVDNDIEDIDEGVKKITLEDTKSKSKKKSQK